MGDRLQGPPTRTRLAADGGQRHVGQQIVDVEPVLALVLGRGRRRRPRWSSGARPAESGGRGRVARREKSIDGTFSQPRTHATRRQFHSSIVPVRGPRRRHRRRRSRLLPLRPQERGERRGAAVAPGFVEAYCRGEIVVRRGRRCRRGR